MVRDSLIYGVEGYVCLGGKYSADTSDVPVELWGYFGAAGYLFLVCEMPVPDCWKGALISGPLRGLEAW